MLNEFRQDLVSGEWVLFAAGRAKRPDQNKSENHIAKQPKGVCPFEDPEKSGNEILATYFNADKSDWFAKAAKNKFPAVIEDGKAITKQVGPFSITEGVGFHEVIIYRDHEKEFRDFSIEELAETIKIYQERYSFMVSQNVSKYILIFHNKGPAAGASIQHPHSQIMSIPILPPDVKRSTRGAEDYYKKHNKRIYDEMISWEIAEQKRIIYENDFFVAFCPFVSKTPYEVRIFPKESHAHFEKMPSDMIGTLADAMSAVFKKIYSALGDPDFNFFIHTAPLEARDVEPHKFYTWHLEIIPEISMIGAFELGSGIDVNVVDPDEAAKLLKETQI